MPPVNHAWASRVLNMPLNPSPNGPDLIDDKKFVEAKFRLIWPIKDLQNAKRWVCQDHQTKYDQQNGKKGFWGLGYYSLKIPVKEITTRDPDEIENLVLQRDLFIVEWDWMQNFPAKNVSGQTPRTRWAYTYRYGNVNYLPGTARAYAVEKGYVYLTSGVSERYFNIQEMPRISIA